MMTRTTRYTPGQLVQVKLNGQLATGKFVRIDPHYHKPLVEINGRLLLRNIKGEAPRVPADPLQVIIPDEGSTGPTTITAQVRTFDINTRFMFIEKMVDMVAVGPVNSLLITGSGGLGKSTTVFNQLSKRCFKENQDFTVVKGFSTPKSLYRKLYENRERGSLLVFDDCDSVIQNGTAVNLLKSCLDTCDVRMVSWFTERGSADEEDGSLPERFCFQGKVIFISNMKLSQVPQPIRSRGLFVDVTMTPDEKIDRMRSLLPQIRADLPLDMKEEAVDLLHRFRHVSYELSIRSLLQVLQIRQAEPRLWKDIAEYQLTNVPTVSS